MSEVEQQAPKAVYRNEETDYDVSKLNPEAQQAFMLLAQLQQNELRQAEITTNHYKAAQAHYNNVIKASDIFHNPSGYGMSSSRITISTAGVLPKIKQFIKEKLVVMREN